MHFTGIELLSDRMTNLIQSGRLISEQSHILITTNRGDREFALYSFHDAIRMGFYNSPTHKDSQPMRTIEMAAVKDIQIVCPAMLAGYVNQLNKEIRSLKNNAAEIKEISDVFK
jgi:hypothetical protein